MLHLDYPATGYKYFPPLDRDSRGYLRFFLSGRFEFDMVIRCDRIVHTCMYNNLERERERVLVLEIIVLYNVKACFYFIKRRLLFGQDKLVPVRQMYIYSLCF